MKVVIKYIHTVPSDAELSISCQPRFLIAWVNYIHAEILAIIYNTHEPSVKILFDAESRNPAVCIAFELKS